MSSLKWCFTHLIIDNSVIIYVPNPWFFFSSDLTSVWFLQVMVWLWRSLIWNHMITGVDGWCPPRLIMRRRWRTAQSQVRWASLHKCFAFCASLAKPSAADKWTVQTNTSAQWHYHDHTMMFFEVPCEYHSIWIWYWRLVMCSWSDVPVERWELYLCSLRRH